MRMNLSAVILVSAWAVMGAERKMNPPPPPGPMRVVKPASDVTPTSDAAPAPKPQSPNVPKASAAGNNMDMNAIQKKAMEMQARQLANQIAEATEKQKRQEEEEEKRRQEKIKQQEESAKNHGFDPTHAMLEKARQEEEARKLAESSMSSSGWGSSIIHPPVVAAPVVTPVVAPVTAPVVPPAASIATPAAVPPAASVATPVVVPSITVQPSILQVKPVHAFPAPTVQQSMADLHKQLNKISSAHKGDHDLSESHIWESSFQSSIEPEAHADNPFPLSDDLYASKIHDETKSFVGNDLKGPFAFEFEGPAPSSTGQREFRRDRILGDIFKTFPPTHHSFAPPTAPQPLIPEGPILGKYVPRSQGNFSGQPFGRDEKMFGESKPLINGWTREPVPNSRRLPMPGSPSGKKSSSSSSFSESTSSDEESPEIPKKLLSLSGESSLSSSSSISDSASNQEESTDKKSKKPMSISQKTRIEHENSVRGRQYAALQMKFKEGESLKRKTSPRESKILQGAAQNMGPSDDDEPQPKKLKLSASPKAQTDSEIAMILDGILQNKGSSDDDSMFDEPMPALEPLIFPGTVAENKQPIDEVIPEQPAVVEVPVVVTEEVVSEESPGYIASFLSTVSNLGTSAFAKVTRLMSEDASSSEDESDDQPKAQLDKIPEEKMEDEKKEETKEEDKSEQRDENSKPAEQVQPTIPEPAVTQVQETHAEIQGPTAEPTPVSTSSLSLEDQIAKAAAEASDIVPKPKSDPSDVVVALIIADTAVTEDNPNPAENQSINAESIIIQPAVVNQPEAPKADRVPIIIIEKPLAPKNDVQAPQIPEIPKAQTTEVPLVPKAQENSVPKTQKTPAPSAQKTSKLSAPSAQKTEKPSTPSPQKTEKPSSSSAPKNENPSAPKTETTSAPKTDEKTSVPPTSKTDTRNPTGRRSTTTASNTTYTQPRYNFGSSSGGSSSKRKNDKDVPTITPRKPEVPVKVEEQIKPVSMKDASNAASFTTPSMVAGVLSAVLLLAL